MLDGPTVGARDRNEELAEDLRADAGGNFAGQCPVSQRFGLSVLGRVFLGCIDENIRVEQGKAIRTIHHTP